MKQFLFLVIASLGFQAQAQMSLQANHFMKVGRAFELAGPVTNDFSGVRSTLVAGRCFMTTSPDLPVAAALAFKAVPSEAGPIEDPTVTIASLVQPGQADVFDSSRVSSIAADAFQAAAFENGELILKVNGAKAKVRYDSKYIYQRLTNTETSQVIANCYYYLFNH